MNRQLRTMLRRSIHETRGRFLAILAIVALGVGFYAGLKSSQPAMLRTVDDYFHAQRFQDFRLLSSLGFTEADVEAFRALEGVAAAEGACFGDAWASLEGREEEVFHFMTLTGEVSVPLLLEGRMPEGPGECLGDEKFFRAEDLGRSLRLTDQNSEDGLSSFTVREFRLVGLARSPRMISGDRGSSELGTGKPAGFVLIPQKAFEGETLHEILLSCDFPGEVYSDDYNEARDRLRPAVETLLNRRGVLRLSELRAEAEQELKTAEEELAEGRAAWRLVKSRAERELREAERELEAGEAKLKAAEQALAVSGDTLSESEASLSRQETDYALRSAALAEKKAILNARQQELTASLSAVNMEKLKLELETETSLSGAETKLSAIYVEILVLQAIPNPDALVQARLNELTAPGGERDQAQAELDALRAEKEAENSQALQELEQEAEQLQAEKAQLDEESAALSAEEMALQALEMEISVTGSALAAGREQASSSWAEIDAGKKELEEGREKLLQAREETERQLQESLREIEEGEQKLQEARDELDRALQLDLYTLDRTSNAGYVGFENDSAIVDAVAVVFPVFFALISALVCVTTMSRMVHEERTQIGTLKAMGYGPTSVMAKYLLYAGLSSLLGCLLGFFLGATLLPWVVWYAYNIMYSYEDLIFVYSLPMFLACFAVAVPGSLLVTRLACRRALAENPASLIRPRSPAGGRRILLERIRPLWQRLPFLTKLSLRSAFRYPARVWMMLLGIGGCTALMVAGFGARDSIARVAEYQYDEISLYDLSVNLAEDEALQGNLPWAEVTALCARQELTLRAGEKSKSTELIAGEASDMEAVVNLHRKDGSAILWPGDGEIVITRKLSEKLGLEEGDRAELQLGDGRRITAKVTGVCEYFVSHAVFASPSLAGGSPDAALIRVAAGEDSGQRAAELRSLEGVNYVSLTRTERDLMESSMESLNLLVLMLVVCSAALAYITLYNLTKINIMERIREVATVQVLGFTPQETAAYVLSENLILSGLGALLGLLLGKLLHRFVMLAIDVDYMSYDIRIAPLSYLVGFMLTLLFAVLTNLLMRRRLGRINMAESLKSVE